MEKFMHTAISSAAFAKTFRTNRGLLWLRTKASASPVRQAATKPVSASTLDINEDGAINAADGILLSRFALGVRGAALVKGQAHFAKASLKRTSTKSSKSAPAITPCK